MNKNIKIREFKYKFFDFFCNHLDYDVLLLMNKAIFKKGMLTMRKQRLKLFVIVFAFLIGGFMITWNHEFLSDQMKAASDYTTGNKVFIGNDSYTIIDPESMTLLKDTATDEGEMTWNAAVASLSNLPSTYGELGSKLVNGHFSLPTSNDLTAITNNNVITTVDPISSDWWLGDESVDNRSRFVGANTNSLVTDVSIVKNILDEANHVCNLDQTTTEQGIKPTVSGNDADVSKDYGEVPMLNIRNTGTGSGFYVYADEDCSVSAGGSVYHVSSEFKYDVFSYPNLGDAMKPLGIDIFKSLPVYIAYTELGLDSYIQQYISNPANGYTKTFTVPLSSGVCTTLKTPMPVDYEAYGNKISWIKSYYSNASTTIDVNIASVVNEPRTVTCGGHAQTAGESSVRPLLSLDKNKIAYSSVTKPSFSISSSPNQSVPVVDGNNAYLTMSDSDLGISLDAGDPDVDGNTLSVDRSNTLISIPVVLSGATSGTRYVSAVANTENGEQYSVLGQVNGTKGSVTLDISSLAHYQTAKKLTVTLYQEVDEGTNTTFRGNATTITLEMDVVPITAISFHPNYPNGNSEWKEGDKGIDTAGALTGSFTFTGGTSGVNDPTSGKDYQKWEIVDASGNPTTDANFRIADNELIAKKKISAGTYTLNIKITDNANETYQDSITITVKDKPLTIDNTNKSQFYDFRLSNGSIADITKWQKENIIIHPKHPVYHQMKVDNGSYQSGDQTYTKEGSNTVALSFRNNSGAVTSTVNEILKIDKTKPTISKVEFSEDGSVKSEVSGVFPYLFKNSADIKIYANDDESGIARYRITITPLKNDGSIDSTKQVIKQNTPSTSNTFAYAISKQGCYLVEVVAEDQVGHSTSFDSKKIKISNQTISLEVKGYLNNNSAKPYNDTKWTNQSITLKLNASDHSALTNQQISFDNSTWQAMPNGIHTIANTSSINDETYYFKAVNIDGEEISTSIKIKLDVDAPENLAIHYEAVRQNAWRSILRMISFDQMFNEEQIARFTAEDSLSGVDHYEYSVQEKDKAGNNVGGAKKGTASSYRLTKDKNYELQVKVYDKAGNVSQTITETVQVDAMPPVINGVKDKHEYKYYYLPRYITVYDKISGLSFSEYTKDGTLAGTIEENVDVKIDEVGEYEIYAIDNAGNEVTITFKIVPLPDIEDIDGSDEAKDIIDQVKDELEEIKNKIDETEKSEYKQWINDALEKWNANRKKVIETDDKSAKVEGQGDTSFDPKTVLIVNPIQESSLPQLPRKAIQAYEVYLQRGNTKIQPDGKIKVYLPYSEEEAAILYEIDGNQVKEIACQREGDYVTFITDKLVKYAISNEAQEVNKNICKLDGIKINIDTDKDGYPDINVDIDNDCVADLNIDMDDDRIPDINIDSDGDGKAEINIDTDDDGKANLNIAFLQQWIPEKVVTINGFTYDTMTGIQPYLNIDDDGDGKPDRNIDANGNGIIDDEENGNQNIGGATDSVNTGDHTKWFLWWILVVLTAMIMVYSIYRKRKESK